MNKEKLNKKVKKFLKSMIEQFNEKGKIKNKLISFEIKEIKKVKTFCSWEPAKYKELTILFGKKNIYGTTDFGEIKVPIHRIDQKEANLCSYQYRFKYQITS